MGCGSIGEDNPVSILREEPPEPPPAPRLLPTPYIKTVYWTLLVPDTVSVDDPMRWTAGVDIRLTGELRQEIIDGLSHFEIETAPSGYRPGLIDTHRPGTQWDFPHAFKRPTQWDEFGIELDLDNRCFDVIIRAVAEPGSGWEDSPAFSTWMFYYIDHSHGFYNPVQPRCIGRDWASNETTRWFSVRGPNRTHVMRVAPHAVHYADPTQ